MTKQVILIVMLSAAAIVFRAELCHVLNAVVFLHNEISRMLHVIFSDDQVGKMIQNLISLLILPFLGGLIVALVFWLVKRSSMPHIMAIVWVLWMVLLTTMVAQTGMTGATQTNVALMHQKQLR